MKPFSRVWSKANLYFTVGCGLLLASNGFSMPGLDVSDKIKSDNLVLLVMMGELNQLRKLLNDYRVQFFEKLDGIADATSLPRKSDAEKEELYKTLIKKKLNEYNSLGFTPLLSAVFYGPICEVDRATWKDLDSEMILPTLGRKRASGSFCVNRGSSVASFREIIFFLIQNGADPAIKATLGPRANLNSSIVEIQGETPLNILVRQAEAKFEHLQSFLEAANLRPDQLNTVSEKDFMSALHAAIADNRFDFARSLVEAGADVNQLRRVKAEELTALGVVLKTIEVTLRQLELKGKRIEELRFGIDDPLRFLSFLIRKGADPRPHINPNDASEKLYGSKALFRTIMDAAVESPHPDIEKWADSYSEKVLLEQKKAEAALNLWLDELESAERAAVTVSDLPASDLQDSEKTLVEPEYNLATATVSISGKGRNQQKNNFKQKTKEVKEIEDDGGLWILVSRKAERSYKPKPPFRLDVPFEVEISVGKLIRVVINGGFDSHVSKRQQESGGHDLIPEEIFHILNSPSVILKKEDQGKTRYEFIAPIRGSMFGHVVVSMGSRDVDLNFRVLTAYWSDYLPGAKTILTKAAVSKKI